MRIRNHKLEGFAYTPARLIGGVIVPEVVVIHDTASQITEGNAAEYLRTTTKASVHYVIEIDGKITQHYDSFEFADWAPQALGLTGRLFAHSAWLQRRTQQRSRAALAAFP